MGVLLLSLFPGDTTDTRDSTGVFPVSFAAGTGTPTSFRFTAEK
jgi:hypothetical protein